MTASEEPQQSTPLRLFLLESTPANDGGFQSALARSFATELIRLMVEQKLKRRCSLELNCLERGVAPIPRRA